MKPPQLTNANLDALIRFLPELDKPGEDFGELEIAYTPSGTLIAPAWLDAAVIVEFEQVAYANGFIIAGFDWSSWGLGRNLVRHPERIATATLATVAKLLTLHVRADRFTGGHLAAMCRCGQIAAILRRLKEIRGSSPRQGLGKPA